MASNLNATTDLKELREAISNLPPGTKEAKAWSELGFRTETQTRDGKEVEVKVPRVPRHVFRDLWLELRVYARPEAPLNSFNAKPLATVETQTEESQTK